MRTRLSATSLVLGGVLAATLMAPSPAVALGSSTDLIGGICTKIQACADSDRKFRAKLRLKRGTCPDKLQGAVGMSLWERFGVKNGGQLKGAEIDALAASGELMVNRAHLAQCLADISALDCGTVASYVTKEFTTVQNLVSDKGACPKVYAQVVPASKTVGQLLDTLCSTYANCQKGTDPQAAREQCVAELNGPAGKTIWHRFGLKKFEHQFTAMDIEQRIASRDVTVDVEDLNTCRERIPTIKCKYFNKYVTASNWSNIAKAIKGSAAGPCKHAFRTTRRM